MGIDEPFSMSAAQRPLPPGQLDVSVAEGVTVLAVEVAVHVLMAAVKQSKSQSESEKNPSYCCKTHQNVHDVTSRRMVLDDTSLGSGPGELVSLTPPPQSTPAQTGRTDHPL